MTRTSNEITDHKAPTTGGSATHAQSTADGATKCQIARIDTITTADRLFLDRVRGISILRVILGHLGLSWFFLPYSSFILPFLSLFFFVSGAVSYASFRRSRSVGRYFWKRIVSIFVPYYLVMTGTLFSFWLSGWQPRVMTLSSVIDLLLMQPPTSSLPFSHGHLWFLHALVIILCVSPILFILIRIHRAFAWIPIAGGVVLSTISLFHAIDGEMAILGHNMYQGVVNLQFFSFGALLYAGGSAFSKKWVTFGLVVSLVSTVATVAMLGLDINFATHSYAIDLYYVSASYACITFMLLAQRPLDWLCNRVKSLNSVLLFAGHHSYSLFMVHIMIIFLLERHAGLDGVAHDPLRAGIKIAAVLAISAAVSIPLTRMTKPLVRAVQNIQWPFPAVSVSTI